MDPRPSVFKYKPLDRGQHSIRLLRVRSELSIRGSLISCQLWHADPSAEYRCISYRWGTPESEVRILVNGAYCKVRANLWSFLNVARQKYSGITLWIDALCINQIDPQEKGHQVGIMGEIYSKASMVFIWLGPKSHSAFADPKVPFYRANHNDELKTLQWICSDEYWTRAWIVQEILLARNKVLLYGSDEISWQTFESTWNDPVVASKSFQNVPIRTLGSRFLGTHTLHSKPLRELLRDHRNMKCSTYHDRIYSLLPLAREGINFPVTYLVSKESLFLHTLGACFESCVCLMHPVFHTLYVNGEEPVFATSLSAAGRGDGVLPANVVEGLRPCLDIVMSRVRQQLSKRGVRGSESPLQKFLKRESGAKDVLQVELKQYSEFPWNIHLTLGYFDEVPGWRCLKFEPATSGEGRDGPLLRRGRLKKQACANVNIIGAPLNASWQVRLEGAALLALAALSKSMEHDCDGAELRNSYKLWPLVADASTGTIN